MHYRKILDFKPSSFANALIDIYAIYKSLVEDLKEIERLSEGIPLPIYVDTPNITAIIGGVYDAKRNSIVFEGKHHVRSTTGSITIQSGDGRPEIEDRSVLVGAEHEKGVPYLSRKLLKKGSPSYDVSWFYDGTKVTQDSEFGDEDILSFSAARKDLFFRRTSCRYCN